MEKSKYYLFPDECGDQNLANFDPQFPIFVLCGIIVSSDKIDTLNKQIDALKLKFWDTTSVILHSRDIRKCDKDFKTEQRGKKEDKNLNLFYSSLLDNGTYWVTSERLRSYCRKFEFKPRSYNINGLQIADLIAYPIARHILDPQKNNPAYTVIEGNIYRGGDKVMGLKRSKVYLVSTTDWSKTK